MSTRVTCPDPSALVSYLYGEFEPGETPGREDVSRHLAHCAVCANEIAALGGVREQLAAWTTPETDLGFQIVQRPAALAETWPAHAAPDSRSAGRWSLWTRSTQTRPTRWGSAWGRLPLAAAAVLVLGAALGLARLDIHYDASGLRVRTGWGHAGASGAPSPTPTPASGVSPAAAVQSAAGASAITAADLVEFEKRLRHELSQSVAAASVTDDGATHAASLSPAADAALMKRVRQIVEESEVRQQQNLQLRVTELARDFQGRRQADLVQIEQGFGRLAGDNAQQRQMIREYLRNVSTTGGPVRPPQ